MTITLAQMKEHSRNKRLFAKKYGVTMRIVQQCISELISYGQLNGWEFTIGEILEYANDEDNVLYQLIDWTDTAEGKISQVNTILQNISLLISIDNKAFEVVEK